MAISSAEISSAEFEFFSKDSSIYSNFLQMRDNRRGGGELSKVETWTKQLNTEKLLSPAHYQTQGGPILPDLGGGLRGI